MVNIKQISAALLILAALGCQPAVKHHQNANLHATASLAYAKGFKVTPIEGGKLVTLIDPEDSTRQTGEFALMDDMSAAPQGIAAIKVPCNRIACLSSTYLSYLIELDAIGQIVAINSSRHVQSPNVVDKINDGTIKKVGIEGDFNLEMIASLNPDVILVSPIKAGGYDALKQLGMPLVTITAYDELTPLGRAEWIKLMGLLTGKEHRADSTFAAIEGRYNHLKSLTQNVAHRPTVLSGKLKSGAWYLPGGECFYAHYFKDAGADYIIKDNNKGAKPYDFEVVYQMAANADFWRILSTQKGDYTSEDLLAEDKRYGDFKAFKEGHVFYCNIAEKPYYEESPIKPDVLLADYIHFFHPELMPEYKSLFYCQLERK
jgi:iron complex transport system substrate-binding protein